METINHSQPASPISLPVPGRVLVVDDNELNRSLLSTRLKQDGLIVEIAANGQQALALMHAQPFDLVLLDIMMPDLNGFQVLEYMKSDRALQQLPVIVISAIDQIEGVARCIELGADDYIPKPFNPVLLKARVSALLEKKRLHDQDERYRRLIEEHNQQLETRVQAQIKELESANRATIFALAKLAESRDPDTGRHLERVREYCRLLAEHLARVPQFESVLTPTLIENIYAASPLHDIGKVGIPDYILLKPGKLTEIEYVTMQTHTLIGAETLRAVDEVYPGNTFVRVGIEIAESHHESWDGTGYPHGLAGEAIPLSGRLLRLADVYDALMSRRAYKEAYSHEKTLGIITAGRGTDFDPNIYDCFISIESEFRDVWLHFHDLESGYGEALFNDSYTAS
jgi:putative two-component system response regulator